MALIPEDLTTDTNQIRRLFNVTSGNEDPLTSEGACQAMGYMLIVKCDGCTDHVSSCPRWDGRTVSIEWSAEATIAFSHMEVICHDS